LNGINYVVKIMVLSITTKFRVGKHVDFLLVNKMVL
jgi:hypothetical protein